MKKNKAFILSHYGKKLFPFILDTLVENTNKSRALVFLLSKLQKNNVFIDRAQENSSIWIHCARLHRLLLPTEKGKKKKRKLDIS